MAIDTLHRDLARRIDQAIVRKGWSRNQLADFAGISRGSLSTIMTGASSPTLRTLKKIATALDMETRELIPSER